MVYHKQTIQTVRVIVMSRATCDLILYVVTPALGLIQVIGRSAS